MADEKELRIKASAEGFDNVSKRGEEMFSKMGTASALLAKNSKEYIDLLSKEISLLEKRNALASGEKTLGARKDYQNALTYGGSQDIFRAKDKLQSVGIETKESKVQTQALQELLAVTKRNPDKAFQQSRQLLQERAEKGQLTPEEKTQLERTQEQSQSRRGRAGQNIVAYSSGVVGSNNIAEAGLNVGGMAANGLMAAGGAVAVAAAAALVFTMVGKDVLDKYSNYRRTQSTLSSISGNENSWGEGLGGSGYGFNMQQEAERWNQMTRLRRRSIGSGGAALNSMMFEKGIGLDAGVYGSIEQLSTMSNNSGYGNTQAALRALGGAGITKGGDMAAVPDYLKIMIGLAQEQVARLGSVDMGINAKMVGALGGMNERLQRSPEYLSGMVGGINSGLMGGNTQMEAMQYSVLSRMYPNKSMMELAAIRDQGIGNKDYARGMFQRIKQTGGDYAAQLKGSFPSLSNQQALDLAEGIKSGNFDETLNKINAEKDVDVKGRARKFTTALDKSSAWKENTEINAAISAIEGFTGALGAAKQGLNELANGNFAMALNKQLEMYFQMQTAMGQFGAKEGLNMIKWHASTMNGGGVPASLKPHS